MILRISSSENPASSSSAVMNGTLPSQRVVEAPLGSLVERVREAGLGTPVVIAIGDVVQLRESLAWYERRPLFGRRVLVTRSEDQAGEMIAALPGLLDEVDAEPGDLDAPPVSPAPDRG